MSHHDDDDDTGGGAGWRPSTPEPDPWRPGAHDEERLAAGGRQQVVTCDRYPPDNTSPDSGHEPAPGGAGRWSFAGLTPVTDYTGDAPTTYTTKAWTRWLAPVQP